MPCVPPPFAPLHAHERPPAGLRRELATEERDIRMAILPFLTAESDCKAAFIKAKLVENEAELMKGVPNWEAGASVYKTTYMAPMTVFGVNQ